MELGSGVETAGQRPKVMACLETTKFLSGAAQSQRAWPILMSFVLKYGYASFGTVYFRFLRYVTYGLA